MRRNRLYFGMRASVIRAFSICAMMAALLAGCSSKDANKVSTDANKESGEAAGSTGGSTAGSESEADTEASVNNQVFTPYIYEDMNHGSVNKKDVNIFYTTKYQSVILADEFAELYPQLLDSLEEDRAKELSNSAISIDELKETAELLSGNSSYNGTELTDEVLVSVLRADENILSVKKECYYYNAGAHGSYYTVGANYDPVTGERLSLNDVVMDIDALIEAADQSLRASHGDQGLSNLGAIGEVIRGAADVAYGEEGFDPGFGWTLGYNDITLYFNPYTLGSYAEGQQVVKLSFEEHPGMMAVEYTKDIPDAYIYRLSNHEDIVYEDVDKDGHNEEINISLLFNGGYEEPAEYVLEVFFNGKQFNTLLTSYDGMENYFVKSANGDCFIYSFTKHENDYTALEICKLNPTGITLSQSGVLEPGIILSYYADQDTGSQNSSLVTFTEIKYALTNPDYMGLSSIFHVLSSYSAYRIYGINGAGEPVSDRPHLITGDYVFTLKQDFEFEECYHTGKLTGKKIQLPKGSKLIPYSTDGETDMVFNYGEGQYVYANVNTNEYPQLINTISSEEVLDGMVFAG